MLQSKFVDILQTLRYLPNILATPIGPSLILAIGSVVVLVVGRWWRNQSRLTAVSLLFVGIATWLLALLWVQTEYPSYSRPWQPIPEIGANLEWFGGGWNWYISGLILLLGGIGILLGLNTGTGINSSDTLRIGAQGISPQGREPTQQNFQPVRMQDVRHPRSILAGHLAFLATALLFVNSRNLLTVVLTWVMMDLIMLIRSAMRPENAPQAVGMLNDNRAKGMSLVGALLLMIGLLPAGIEGLGLPLGSSALPYESVLLMLVAAAIRAGTYPFHLWLLPADHAQVDLSERLLDHVVPVLCGLWLLGWTVSARGEQFLVQWPILALIILMLLGSAIAAWSAPDKPTHTTFVLVTSAGLAGLAGALASNQGPNALIWPTTAFALGGGLWLVGERAWQEWGWQIPVSVGALTLAGVPFTPGFLTQPALSRLLTGSGSFRILFIVFVLAQTIQIAALLRSWSAVPSGPRRLRAMAVVRLLFSCTAIGLALAFSGIQPSFVQGLAKMPGSISQQLGQYPSVIADSAVWLTLTPPLILGCLLAIVRHQVWGMLGSWATRVSYISRLEWLFQASWWSINSVSDFSRNITRVVEGAGYMGWLVVFGLLGYLLVN